MIGADTVKKLLPENFSGADVKWNCKMVSGRGRIVDKMGFSDNGCECTQLDI